MSKRKAFNEIPDIEDDLYFDEDERAKKKPTRPRWPGDGLPAQMKDGSDNFIKTVNALSKDEFFKHFGPGRPSMWEFDSAEAISKHYLNLCFDLIEETSREDYENSSLGWHPRRKLKEMKQQGMRYLLIEKDDVDQPLYGFLSFLPTHDSTPSVPVLYIYEIHLHENARGEGNGKVLMKMAMDIAKGLGVEKVMLTCFLSNEIALAFYRSLGYETDTCSPQEKRTRKKLVKPDYVILSKRVRDSSQKTGVLGQEVEGNDQIDPM
ncbi:hypothetical protein B0A50_01542 [Salinomyces thailandicus]|uniref:N-alpha-acetyltransferase 40 n=1 Tax=Salinomyces thailandicus TaxID=706561 RepID=A0A4U0UDM3_9PEZI|nr:hypothetical protein B0A50_01542 [Salinomyces thailandica]